MVTVIATGFNKKSMAQKPLKSATRLVDRIPSGPSELQKLDEPSFMRRGVELPFNAIKDGSEEKEKIDKSDPDKPAFLRKIMD